MNNKKSFIENMQNANFGKSGMYIAGVTILGIVCIKLLFVPIFAPLQQYFFFRQLQFWNNLIENIALANIFIFFGCIIFFKEKIGSKLIHAMQLKDKSYFKEKWILLWLSSIWISIGILAVTTVINQALFKSWGSFIWLCIFICIPLFMMPKIMRTRNTFFK